MGHGVEGRTAPPAQLDAESAASVAATLQALATPSRLRILPGCGMVHVPSGTCLQPWRWNSPPSPTNYAFCVPWVW